MHLLTRVLTRTIRHKIRLNLDRTRKELLLYEMLYERTTFENVRSHVHTYSQVRKICILKNGQQRLTTLAGYTVHILTRTKWVSCICLGPSALRLLENATDTFSYHVEDLTPYTQYLFRVVVSHAHGQTAGPWSTLHTAEDSKFIYCTQTHTCTCTHLTWLLLIDACSYTYQF